MIVEMPVLDNALLAVAVAFTPMHGGADLRRAGHAGRAADRASWCPACRCWPTSWSDWFRQDPAPGAAVLQGLFFGRTAPHRSERRHLETPALILGHRRDPIHPFSDAGMLVDELPNARLVEADSIIELRLAPERLTAEIAAFVDECWSGRSPPVRRRPTRPREAARC